ncbi:MAG: RIP metalloprotease RseP [Limimaricola sp.]|uniref:RIP metalloprotease RseP n=1 Tax=Limimaricola sp. TaxID=2211665 RepID=UPI001D86CD98|nr:RIP metalloprotease RseP [Limimaricola sp.]MBI1418013.1 RIP metalloprotease RseP [Limimaricola sp.]
MTQILPEFGSTLFTLAAFLVALSIIVAVHEYGHYIVARWSGIKADVFSLGFGPVVYSRVDRRGTRWQLALLPLGGYVKFHGDSNAASVGSTPVAASEQRQTMLGAPLWARAATVAAGPVFNFILSIGIFASVAMLHGQTADPLTMSKADPLPPGYVQQLQPGDQILAIAGQATPASADFDGYLERLPVEPVLDYTVRRNGAETVVQGPYPYPPAIIGVSPTSAANDAGLKPGDVITAIDGKPIFAFSQIVSNVSASGGKPLLLDIWNNGQTRTVTLSPRRVDLPKAGGAFETRWLIGVTGGLFFEPVTMAVGPLQAVQMAVSQLWFILTSSLSGFVHMMSGAISSCNISGPIGIAQTSGAMAAQGAASFIWFVAVLSAAVGLLNLFPIPVLDGGHLVFIGWEAITGRAPGGRTLQVLMAAGLSLILALMAFAVANDLFLCH